MRVLLVRSMYELLFIPLLFPFMTLYLLINSILEIVSVVLFTKSKSVVSTSLYSFGCSTLLFLDFKALLMLFSVSCFILILFRWSLSLSRLSSSGSGSFCALIVLVSENRHVSISFCVDYLYYQYYIYIYIY